MSKPQTESIIAEAAKRLRHGGLVAFPTETVYGLGADATNEAAIRKIFEVKGRPPSNPLIIHVTGVNAAAKLTTIDGLAAELAKRFWPGPLTLVLERRPDSRLSPLATGGLSTVAIRAPALPIARELLQLADCPIAAPSANKSGHISPTRAAHVRAQLGDLVDMVVDGGPCPLGLESTVLDLSGPTPAILRPGSTTQEALEEITGPLADPKAGTLVRSPGTQARHYAPKATLRLNATDVRQHEAYLAFGPNEIVAANIRNLSPSGDLTEASANLYSMLIDLDASGVTAIAVAPIPSRGLGTAINDRLRRAARR